MLARPTYPLGSKQHGRGASWAFLLVSLSCFVACGETELAGGPFDTPTADAPDSSGYSPLVSGAEIDAMGEAFVAALPAGWASTRGGWSYVDLERCFVPGGSCYGNNPSSPYGFPTFPESSPDDVVSAFQWRRDEAVVIFMRTPPQVRYFAFTQYLFQAAHAEEPDFASLSDSLNLGDMRTAGSTSPGVNVFDQSAVLVWTSNLKTLESVQVSLAAMGFPAGAVNFMPMPASIPGFTPTQGYGPDSDTFAMLMRTALPSNPAALDSYMREAPFYVVKVGPVTPSSFVAAPTTGYAEEATGIVESAEYPGLEQALSSLVSDIRARYSSQLTFTRQAMAYGRSTGWDCLASGTTCRGDNHDALYSMDTPAPVVPVTLRDVVLVVGVNHRRTGKATYLNHSVYDLEHLAGITSVADPALTSASALYHAGIGARDAKALRYRNLYAYFISYDCTGRSYCLQIPAPTEANPVGLVPGTPFIVLGRAYMEPHSGVRPATSEIVPHQVFIGR